MGPYVNLKKNSLKSHFTAEEPQLHAGGEYLIVFCPARKWWNPRGSPGCWICPWPYMSTLQMSEARVWLSYSEKIRLLFPINQAKGELRIQPHLLGALWREPRDIKSPLTPSQGQSCGSVCLINPPGWKHQLLVIIHWVCDLPDFRKLCLKLSWYLSFHSFYPLVLVLSLRDPEINSLSSSTFLLLSCLWSPKLSSWVFSSVYQFTQIPFLVSQITWHLIPLTVPALLLSLLYDCR